MNVLHSKMIKDLNFISIYNKNITILPYQPMLNLS